MPDHFLTKMVEHFPELPAKRSLLAVSAGIDSVVMAQLFAAAAWDFGIAHCNFQLRGPASQGDEDFVRALAQQWQVPFYTVAFDTEKAAQEAGISVQMVARDLRYEWLEQIRRTHSFDQIVTAHHLNDSMETSLLNQSRGTGIRGILGIPQRQEFLIRPMLAFTRQDIAEYADRHQVSYREDSSNSKDEYYRNRIRHHVIPVLKSINPALEATFKRNLSIWSEAAYLMQWACQRLREQYLLEKEGEWLIDLAVVQDHPAAALSLLYEWLAPCGFHPDQLAQAIHATGQGSGAVWYSATHRLLHDRAYFIVEPLVPDNTSEQRFYLPEIGTTLILPDGKFSAEVLEGQPEFAYRRSDWEVCLDAGQVSFPLEIRHWQAGDSFCPLGMHGRHKKVQDLFTDQKLSRFAKDKVWLVLAADGQIIWVMGLRLDERYKLRPESESTLLLRFVAGA